MDSTTWVSNSHGTQSKRSAYFPENYSAGALPPRSEYGLCHRPWTCPSSAMSKSNLTQTRLRAAAAAVADGDADGDAAAAAAPVPAKSAAFTQFDTLTTAHTLQARDRSRGPGAAQWETTYSATLAARRPAGFSAQLPRQESLDARSSRNDGLAYYTGFRGAGLRGPGFVRRTAGQIAHADGAGNSSSSYSSANDEGSSSSGGVGFIATGAVNSSGYGSGNPGATAGAAAASAGRAVTQSFGFTQRWSVPPRSLWPSEAQSSYRKDLTDPAAALAAHSEAVAAAVGSDALARSFSRARVSGEPGTGSLAGISPLTARQRTRPLGADAGGLMATATAASLPYSTADLMAGTSKVFPGVPAGYAGHLPAARLGDSDSGSAHALRHAPPGQARARLDNTDQLATIRRGVVGYAGHQPATARNALAQAQFSGGGGVASADGGAHQQTQSIYAPAASSLPSAAVMAPLAVGAVNGANNRSNAVITTMAKQ